MERVGVPAQDDGRLEARPVGAEGGALPEVRRRPPHRGRGEGERERFDRASPDRWGLGHGRSGGRFCRQVEAPAARHPSAATGRGA